MRSIASIALSIALCTIASAASVPGLSVRGKLVQAPDKTPALDTGDHKLIHLTGDDDTVKVLEDERLAGADFEAIGHFNSPDHFQVDPITSTAMFVYKNGKRYTISYWCDVCYIRTYSPGKCVCC